MNVATSLGLVLTVAFLSGCSNDAPLVEDAGVQAGRQVVSIRGQTWVDGEETIVHVTAGVPEGRDADEVALEALYGQAPDARPLREQDRYEFIAIEWDTLPVLSNFNGNGGPGSVSGNQRQVWLDSQTMWQTSGTSFEFADNGDTSRCPSLAQECQGPQKFDGNNDFGWINITDQNTLGVTWTGTSIDEYDMVLDGPGWNWYSGAAGSIPGNGVDMQTIAGHEFGHALGLGHSNVNGALMEAFYSLGTTQRTLSADDQAGVEAKYPIEVCLDDPECDDANTCTIDTCDAGECNNTPDVGAACDPAGSCTDGTCNATGGCDEGPTCPECSPHGTTCSTGDDCCSGNCKRGTCKGN